MSEKLFARGVSRGFIIIMIGIIGGIFGGISASFFIWMIQYAQNLREINPKLIFILPLAGAIIGLLRGAPKLIVGSFLTHLGGGSTGREGAVIHFAENCARHIGKYFNYPDRKLHRLVIISMGAGFGAALGAPWAGLFFGFEFNKSKIFRPWTLLHAGIAGLIAQTIGRLARIPHFHIPEFEIPNYEMKIFILVLISGILFGLVTSFFHYLRHQSVNAFAKTSPWIAGAIGGGFLTLLFYQYDLREFQGLGKETMALASQEVLPLIFTVKKIIISIISLAAGFQGGEFFPLAFIGSTLGSAFSFVDPSLTPLMAALGIVATYGASTQTPIACTLLACELFGWKILPFAMLTLWIAARILKRISLKDEEG